ncbi:MAG: phosphonopyruvate decarboxylase [Pelagibacterales bacterium]|nr:phosphonopyruvate decarboxylase [Pelagibacterales bacterium]
MENWSYDIYQVLSKNNARQIAYVPDAGHKSLIEYCANDKFMNMISLTSEEEGMGLLAGAWLGGEKGVLLMQSSGVGNCINAIASITRACNFPLLMLITMRGEWNEFNPWQVPMGQATEKVLDALNVVTIRCEKIEEISDTVSAMMGLAYKSNCISAVLLSQRLIGAKSFKE